MRKLIFLLLTTPAAGLALEVPVADLDRWTILEFNGIEPNRVTVADGAMRIAVRASASPLIYKLDAPTRISGVTVTGSWSGELRLPEGVTQGDDDADDFVLKIGVVESGERTLNWFQRRIAADWIKQLFELAPGGSGVERINFLTATQQPELVGSERTHPLNDLLYETRILSLDGPGAIVMRHDFPEPVETLGLWISVDGDDTGSDFDLRIDHISLHTD